MENDGDHDDSPAWDGDNLDTNEFIVTLRLRTNLEISEIIMPPSNSAEVDATIPIGIILQNTGNVHATDIEIVLCEYGEVNSEITNELRENGCDEENVVMRQVVGALLAPDDTEEAKSIELTCSTRFLPVAKAFTWSLIQ